jgi:hypothetical protein
MCFLTSAERSRHATAAWVLMLLLLLSQYFEDSMQGKAEYKAHNKKI